MKNKLLDVLEKRTLGIHCGIPSFCSANKIVIEAIMDQAKRFDDTVLIEATSNQVNQFGGYMDMTSAGAIALHYGITMKVVRANVINLKITYADDMDLFVKLVDNYFFPKETN